MAVRHQTVAACLAVLLAACGTPPDIALPAAADGPALRPKVVDTSLPCADLAGRRLQETNPVQLATLDLLENACALPTEDLSLADAEAILADKQFALVTEGETLTLFQIAEGRAPSICCSLQDASWRDLGDGRTYVARLHLKNLQTGMLKLTEIPIGQPVTEGDFINWRGPGAPPEPFLKPDLDGTLSDLTLYSPELGETRKLAIYEPPNRGDALLPALYQADGDAVPQLARIIEPLILSGEIAPILIVGMRSGQDGIVEDRSELGWDIRGRDYNPIDFPGEPPSRFEPHLAYVTDTLVPWVDSQFNTAPEPEMRAISGYSNGGVFTLNAGYRSQDVFGHVWPMSLGIAELETAVIPEVPPAQFRLSAGYYEPHFIRATQVSAQTLRDAGYSVDTHWYADGHMSDQWDHRLLQNLKAVFPGPAARTE